VEGDKPNIAERSFTYALRVIKLNRELQRDEVGRVWGRQFLRSSTSIGANVHEAQGGQSKADFIAKMSIAHKEALETLYWIRLLQESRIIHADRLCDITDETQQIVRVLSSILLSAKRNGKKQ
jgi:four helix bundle protein